VDVLENPLFFEKLILSVSSISLIVFLLGEETGDSLSGMQLMFLDALTG